MISKWGSVIAEMISGYGKSMLEKWVQGVGRPDHPTIISEMILRGGPVQPPECWGDIFPIIWPSKSWRVLGWVALKTGAFFSDSWYLSLSVLRRRSWKKMKSIWQRPQKVLARAVPIWFSPKTRTLDWPRWAEVEDFFCSCENLLDWICTKKQVVY